jgi:hypothetical protein
MIVGGAPREAPCDLGRGETASVVALVRRNAGGRTMQVWALQGSPTREPIRTGDAPMTGRTR